MVDGRISGRAFANGITGYRKTTQRLCGGSGFISALLGRDKAAPLRGSAVASPLGFVKLSVDGDTAIIERPVLLGDFAEKVLVVRHDSLQGEETKRGDGKHVEEEGRGR